MSLIGRYEQARVISRRLHSAYSSKCKSDDATRSAAPPRASRYRRGGFLGEHTRELV